MSDPLYCSFCGKSQHEVRKLIAGPTVFICDECVEACRDIVAEPPKVRRTGPEVAQLLLHAFGLLKDHGFTDADGNFHRWTVAEKQREAERMVEWAWGEPLSVPTPETQERTPPEGD